MSFEPASKLNSSVFLLWIGYSLLQPHIFTEILSLVMTFLMCLKNICSYFRVKSFVSVGFGKTVVSVVGSLNFCGIILYHRTLR